MIILESREKRQVLHSYPSADGDVTIGTMYWAGDIDNDGRLDIIANLYVHSNIGYVGLFLSSLAKEGKLVKKAAEFVTSGC